MLRTAQFGGDVGSVWNREMRFYKLSDWRVQCECAEGVAMVRLECAPYTLLVVTEVTRELRQAYFHALSTDKVLIICGPVGSGKTETLKDTCHILGIEPIILDAKDFHQQGLEVFKSVERRGHKTPIILDEASQLPQAAINAFVTNAKAIGAFVCMATSSTGSFPAEVMNQSVVFHTRLPELEFYSAALLSSNGFDNCDDLARNLVSLWNAFHSGCSMEHYYDFGLRAVRRVTSRAGYLLGSHDEVVNAQEQRALVAQAILQTLWCCLTKKDKNVLEALIINNFGILPPLPEKLQAPGHWPRVAAMLAHVFEEQGYHAAIALSVAAQDEKTCLAAIEREAEEAGAELKILPGTMAGLNIHELLGKTDGNGCWVDGTLTQALRSAQHSRKPVWFSLMCGKSTVDMQQDMVEKFEALNTLMDIRKLCLTTGEILSLTEGHRIIFISNAGGEVCSFLSLATISRFGFVHAAPDE